MLISKVYKGLTDYKQTYPQKMCITQIRYRVFKRKIGKCGNGFLIANRH